MKAAYFGYDFFIDCFETALSKNIDIIKIFSFECDNKDYNFNTELLALGKKNNIPIGMPPPTADDIKALEQDGCELIISAGYAYKIPDLGSSKIKGINIHPSILPEGRGRWPLPWHILRNAQKSGISIHKISNKWDAGDILSCATFPLDKQETLESLSCKSRLCAKKLLGQTLDNFDFFWNNAHPQDETKSSYWNMPSDQDFTIDFTKTTREIDRVIRAFGNFDSCATFNDKEWIIQSATCWVEAHAYQAGEVVLAKNREILIASQDGFVCLRSFRIDPDFSGE